MLTLVKRTFGSKTTIAVSGDVRATVTIKRTARGDFFWKVNADDGSKRAIKGYADTLDDAESQSITAIMPQSLNDRIS